MWLAGERITATEWLAVPVILGSVALVVAVRGRPQAASGTPPARD
jgi:hypothetical protein